MFHFLLHITGGDNGSGPWYLEESGFMGLLFCCGFAIKWLEQSRCHHGGHGLKGCKRHGRYPFHHFKLCHKHHPKAGQKHLMHLYIKHKKEQSQ